MSDIAVYYVEDSQLNDFRTYPVEVEVIYKEDHDAAITELEKKLSALTSENIILREKKIDLESQVKALSARANSVAKQLNDLTNIKSEGR